MAKQIKGNEIIEDNHLDNAVKSVRELTKGYEILSKEIKETAKLAKTDLGKANTNTAKGIREVNAEVQKSTTLKKASLAVDKDIEKSTKLITSLTDKQVKEKLKLQRANKEQRDGIKALIVLEDKQAGEEEKLLALNTKLRLERKKLIKTDKDYVNSLNKINRELDENNAKIKENSDALKKQKINVGNYGSALDELKGSLEGSGVALGELTKGGEGGGISGFGGAVSGVLTKLGPWGVAIGTAVAGAGALAAAVIEVDKEFDTLRGTIAQLTGEEGKSLDNLTRSIKAFETTFDADINESLRATNVLMREFGLSGVEATKLIEQGFLSNANIQGDLLDSVNEYSTQIRAAGGDAGDLFKILEASGTAGVFSDKGIDTVKEFGLRIREQATATSDALTKGLGEDFTNNLFKGINDGSISTIEALQSVTTALKEAEISTKDRQTIIADVFGGAGEDAVGFLDTLTQINFETKFAADLSGDLAKQRQKEFEANKQLAGAQNRLSKAIGDSSAIGRIWTNIQTAVIEKLTDFIIGVESLTNSFSLLKTDPIDALKGIFNALNNFLLIPVRFAIDEMNLLLGLFTDFQIPDFDINLPTKELNEFNAAQRENARITRIASKNITNLEQSTGALIVAENQRIQSLIDGNLSQEDRNALISDLTEKYPELIKNYDLENLTQEQAVELQKQLRIEIAETTILKQKSLAITLLNSRVEEEQFKINQIRNETVRKQKQEELNFEKQRQLQRIDNIEQEVRNQLGLNTKIEELNDSATDNAIDNDGKRVSSFKSSSDEIIDHAEIEEQRLADLRSQRQKDIDNNNKENDKARDKRDKEERERIAKNNKIQEDADKARLDKEKELAAERLQQQKDNFQALTDLLNSALEIQQSKIDSQIENSKNNIEESQTAVDTLQQKAILGNADAEASIKAEKQKIANEKENINALEKKKRDLQILITGLAFANEKIQNGDGNALANAGSEMANFISSLKGFYNGTETTLGADLGNAYAITGDRDTHIIKAHKDEHIIGVENSRKLGNMSQDDIVQGALMLKNGEFVGRRAINAVNQVDIFNDSRMISAMSEVKQAINNIQIPEHHFNYDAVNRMATETIILGNKRTNNHTKLGGMFS